VRVCFVTPPSPFLIDQRVFVALGILRVAACLPDPVHVDLNGDPDAPLPDADIYAVTATTPQMPHVARIAARLPRGSRLVLGGPHVTLTNAARKRGTPRALRAWARLEAMADVLVAGDGEMAIHAAVAPNAPLLIDADDPASPYWVRDQDALPLPRRDLVDLSTYRYEIDGVRATSVVAQLGCPFECAFCGGRFSPSLRRIRTHASLVHGETCLDYGPLPIDSDLGWKVYAAGYDHCMTHYTPEATGRRIMEALR
jgi:hypothetical protein